MHAALVIIGFHANDDVPLLHECVSMLCVYVCYGIRPSIATKTIIIRRMHRWVRIVRCTKCWNCWQIVEHNVTAVHQNATTEFMGQGCRTILHRLRINWSTMLWAFHDCTIIIVIDGKSRNKFENPNLWRPKADSLGDVGVARWWCFGWKIISWMDNASDIVCTRWIKHKRIEMHDASHHFISRSNFSYDLQTITACKVCG